MTHARYAHRDVASPALLLQRRQVLAGIVHAGQQGVLGLAFEKGRDRLRAVEHLVQGKAWMAVNVGINTLTRHPIPV